MEIQAAFGKSRSGSIRYAPDRSRLKKPANLRPARHEHEPKPVWACPRTDSICLTSIIGPCFLKPDQEETKLNSFTTITGWATQLKGIQASTAIAAPYQVRPQTCQNLDELLATSQLLTCVYAVVHVYAMHVYIELTCFFTCNIDFPAVFLHCLSIVQIITLFHLVNYSDIIACDTQ
ncbi:TPA: hypothetical protein ACH3X1_008018 [Trebouxia sp. C0004]